MAAGETSTRDTSGSRRHLLPPGATTQFDHLQAPVDTDRSFLVGLENTAVPADDSVIDLLCPDLDGTGQDVASTSKSLRYSLPPPEMRLPGYRTREEIDRNRIPTPVDTRGIVDIDELIRRVKGTVDPNYSWPGYCDEHHTLWPAYRYSMFETFRPDVDAVSFRNLAMNKIWIPRVFHNWIHVVTDPPEVPEAVVMQESIEEWIIIRDFFGSVKQTTNVMRLYERERSRRQLLQRPLTESQEALLSVDMQRRLGGVFMHFNQLEEVELSRWPISKAMGLHAAAGQIGDLVLRGWQRRTKDVRRKPESLFSEVFEPAA